MLGKLLERAQAGKRLEAGATVSQLLDLYMPLAEWDVSTREGFEGYVRRTIRPGLGHLKVRKEVHGPILDTFYARLKKCGDLTCNGKPFTERHNVPAARPARRAGTGRDSPPRAPPRPPNRCAAVAAPRPGRAYR